MTFYHIVKYWAGHAKQGESTDKKWAAVLLHAQQEGVVPDDEASPSWAYVAVHGKSGSNYVGGLVEPVLTQRHIAENQFNIAVRGKKAYHEIAGPHTGFLGLSEFLPYFKVAPLLPPNDEQGSNTNTTPIVSPPSVQPRPRLNLLPCTLKVIGYQQLQTRIADSQHYGLSEKVDGVRCLVRFDGQELSAYNRNGELLASPPAAAESLKALGQPFLLDGEQMTGRYAGVYVVFDAVTLGNGGESTTQPFQQRASLLEQAMIASGLVSGGAPSLSHALSRCLLVEKNLALLTVTKSTQEAQSLLDDIMARKAEGVVVRRLTSLYNEARAVQKYKLYDTIDAIGIGIRQKGQLGSITLGLVRESDGATIEIGHVRSGLRPQDVVSLREQIEQGHYPVLAVSYILDSTHGITLVQPSTSVKDGLRVDKYPFQCTTGQLIDQLGEDRHDLIERAEKHDTHFASRYLENKQEREQTS